MLQQLCLSSILLSTKPVPNLSLSLSLKIWTISLPFSRFDLQICRRMMLSLFSVLMFYMLFLVPCFGVNSSLLLDPIRFGLVFVWGIGVSLLNPMKWWICVSLFLCILIPIGLICKLNLLLSGFLEWSSSIFLI